MGHITTDSWKGRGNQYIQLVKILYCKLPTVGKQLPAFPLEVRLGTEPQSQRWEERVFTTLPLWPPQNQFEGPKFRNCSIFILLYYSCLSRNSSCLYCCLEFPIRIYFWSLYVPFNSVHLYFTSKIFDLCVILYHILYGLLTTSS